MAFLKEYPHGKELLTINNAKARADVSRRTIYNWMRNNKIDYCRTTGGSIRIVANTLFRNADGSIHDGNKRHLGKIE